MFLNHYSLINFFLIICLSITGPPQDTRQAVIITNIDNKKGNFYIGWYKTAEDLRKKTNAVFSKIEPVSGTTEQIIYFPAVPSGTYAIAVFLDENGNGKIDTNILGIPKEKYGFSNNKFPLTRAPSFKEAAILINEKNDPVNIRLK